MDELLQRAASRLPDIAVAALAEELRTAGREQAAFRLYAVAADTMATSMSSEALAQLCVAMKAAGQGQHRQRIAMAAITAADQSVAIMSLVEAFLVTAQEDLADLTLTNVAHVLPIGDVAAVAAKLRELDRHAIAYQFCEQAIVGRPAGAILALETALRESGRPVDAKNLITAAARRLPASVVSGIIIQRSPPDAQRLIEAAALRGAQEVGELMDALLTAQPVHARALAELISAMPVNKVVEICTAVRSSDALDLVLTTMLTRFSRSQLIEILTKLRPGDAKRLLLISLQDNQYGVEIMTSLSRVSPPTADGIHPIRLLLTDQPIEDLAQLITSLCQAGLTEYAVTTLTDVALKSRDIERIASTVVALNDAGLGADAEYLFQKWHRLQGAAGSSLDAPGHRLSRVPASTSRKIGFLLLAPALAVVVIPSLLSALIPNAAVDFALVAIYLAPLPAVALLQAAAILNRILIPRTYSTTAFLPGIALLAYSGYYSLMLSDYGSTAAQFIPVMAQNDEYSINNTWWAPIVPAVALGGLAVLLSVRTWARIRSS